MSNSTHPVVAGVAHLYGLLVFLGNHLQSPLLYVLRFIWGIQLMQAGFGKLLNIQMPIGYFRDLGIPFPVENAWLVSCTETLGGIFLALGLLTRLTAVPLIINFIVAYLTTEQEALKKLAHFDTDKFVAADPYPYLALALIMLAFGPGAISLDYVLARWRKVEWKGPKL
jgi:putative oxidoreductase